jgi:hypothetical protein
MGLIGPLNPSVSPGAAPLASSVDALGPSADLKALADLFRILASQKGAANVGGAPFANALSSGFMTPPPASFGLSATGSSNATEAAQLLTALLASGGLGKNLQASYGSPPYGGASFSLFGASPRVGAGPRASGGSSSSTSCSGNPLNITGMGGNASAGPGGAAQSLLNQQMFGQNNNLFGGSSASSGS